MEAVLFHSSSPDQSISPYKHIRNPNRNHFPLLSRAPCNFRGGVLHAPPQQPPLLPLPNPNLGNYSRGLSCPPINRKMNNRTRGQSLTPKKSKQSTSPKKGDSERDLKPTKTAMVIASTDPLGPDPKELPKDVSRVLSPPPSSLPLPTFSLRPKLICNSEAAGIDAGATDNLRRLLHLT